MNNSYLHPPAPPRPAPKPHCPHCKDGGCAPFYTLHEKDPGGWHTGRNTIMCHTCYHMRVQPKFTGEVLAPPVIEEPSSLHVTGPEQDNVTLKQQQQAMHGSLPVQVDASQRALQATTGQTSYSGQQMKTIIESSPAPDTKEVISSQDDKTNVAHVEAYENEHSTSKRKRTKGVDNDK